jgi:hypothetical protein
VKSKILTFVLAVKAKNREKCFCDKQKTKIIARSKSKKSVKVLLLEAKFDCFIGAEKNTVCFHTGTHSHSKSLGQAMFLQEK